MKHSGVPIYASTVRASGMLTKKKLIVPRPIRDMFEPICIKNET